MEGLMTVKTSATMLVTVLGCATPPTGEEIRKPLSPVEEARARLAPATYYELATPGGPWALGQVVLVSRTDKFDAAPICSRDSAFLNNFPATESAAEDLDQAARHELEVGLRARFGGILSGHSEVKHFDVTNVVVRQATQSVLPLSALSQPRPDAGCVQAIKSGGPGRIDIITAIFTASVCWEVSAKTDVDLGAKTLDLLSSFLQADGNLTVKNGRSVSGCGQGLIYGVRTLNQYSGNKPSPLVKSLIQSGECPYFAGKWHGTKDGLILRVWQDNADQCIFRWNSISNPNVDHEVKRATWTPGRNQAPDVNQIRTERGDHRPEHYAVEYLDRRRFLVRGDDGGSNVFELMSEE